MNKVPRISNRTLITKPQNLGVLVVAYNIDCGSLAALKGKAQYINLEIISFFQHRPKKSLFCKVCAFSIHRLISFLAASTQIFLWSSTLSHSKWHLWSFLCFEVVLGTFALQLVLQNVKSVILRKQERQHVTLHSIMRVWLYCKNRNKFRILRNMGV